MSAPIYLDYNATTATDAAVVAAMMPYFRGDYANAASHHSAGRAAKRAVDNAREQVAAAVDAHPAEVIFTASGTESNNTIIKGVAKMSIAKTIAVGGTEHPCVLCSARSLAGAFLVDFIAVDGDGQIDRADLARSLQNDCALVSIMTANNETGALQDIRALADMARSAGAVMHTDSAQAMGKIPLSFSDMGVDAMTLSGHKFYAPKGTAALIARREVAFAPLLEGGGHEDGRRSGTLNVAGIVGFGVACEIAAERARTQSSRYAALRDEMESALGDDAVIFGRGAARLPNTSYFGYPGIDGDAMVTMLDQSGFCVTSGAACASMKDEPSHVLLAMDVAPDVARSAVRFSLGAGTTHDEVVAFARAARAIAVKLKSLSSLA